MKCAKGFDKESHKSSIIRQIPKKEYKLKTIPAFIVDRSQSNIDKKKVELEEMSFKGTEARVTNSKLLLRLASEERNLTRAQAVELALRYGATTFLAGKKHPKPRTPLRSSRHKVKAHMITGGANEYLIQRAISAISMLQNNPCEVKNPKLSAT